MATAVGAWASDAQDFFRSLARDESGLITDQGAISMIGSWAEVNRPDHYPGALPLPPIGTVDVDPEFIRSVVASDIGLIPPPASIPVETFDRVQFEGFSRQRIRYAVDHSGNTQVDWAWAFLFIPDDTIFPAPAVLALHQTVPIGKDQVADAWEDDALDQQFRDPVQAHAPWFARRGVIVLAPDSLGYGERLASQANAQRMAQDAAHLSLAGKMLHDHRCALSMLMAQSAPNGMQRLVNPRSVGVIGHSLGGMNALFLAAFDDRITCAAISAGYTRITGDGLPGRFVNYVPAVQARNEAGISPPWDYEHVLALICPRPCIQFFGLNDANFPPAPLSGTDGAVEIYGRLPDAVLGNDGHQIMDLFPATSVSNAAVHATTRELYRMRGATDAFRSICTVGLIGEVSRGGHSPPIQVMDLLREYVIDHFLAQGP